MTRLRLCENLRAPGYAPFYYALSGHYLPDAGIDVELITSPSPSRTGAMILEGSADISWGGPMRVMLQHQTDRDCPLICFGLVVSRDPFMLVAKLPNPSFCFRDLIGLRIAAVSEVPTPWMMFQDDLARAGLDPATFLRVPDCTMERSVAALLNGSVDVVQVFEPYVDQLLKAGCHVWHRFSDRGEVAYTSFYSTRDFVERNRGACGKLIDGMAAALSAFHSDSAAQVVKAIQPFFPDLPCTALARIVTRYREANLWARTPTFSLAGFLRLKAALVSGGLIDRDFPYELIVDTNWSPL